MSIILPVLLGTLGLATARSYGKVKGVSELVTAFKFEKLNELDEIR